jgi:hypothetical protein
MKPLGPHSSGLLAFVVSFVGLLVLFGPTTCNDGWRSPSIGRQGACSWHGGVNMLPQQFAFWFSLFVGWVVYKWVSRRLEREQVAMKDAWAKDGSVCPKRGSPMTMRIAKRGARKGNVFLGCTRFPICRGTRDI